MANPAQRSFRYGEISPSNYANADKAFYADALKTARNVVVMRGGGVQSAPGTEYLGSTKADGVARLVEAVFDDGAEYVLEFGDEYVRFWLDGALVAGSVSGAWSGSSVSYTAGVVVSNGGTNYVCIAAHTSGSGTEPGVGGTWETVWYALTGTIYELPTPYGDDEVFALKFAEQYNVLTIVHPNHEPATLTRTSNAVWDLADIDFADAATQPTNFAVSGSTGSGVGYTVTAIVNGVESTAPAMINTNISITGGPFAIQTALAAAPRTISWDAVTGASAYKVYTDWLGGGVASAFILVTTSGTSFVDAGTTFFGGEGFGAPPTSSGSFAATGDFPSAVAAYQQRLILGGSDNDPDVVEASQVALPYNFDVSDPIVDSDALSWRQVGKRLNRVVDFAEVAERLVQFSTAGEQVIAGDVDGILRPGEVNPRQVSANGSARYPGPLIVNDTALYVQARGGIVRDLVPLESQGFSGSDLTLLAAHLVDGYTITDWTYQQTPHSVVWAVRSDGVLLALTYVRELGIVGWTHRDTLGLFESVACVPENGRDAVYAVVKRTIDGSTVRYVERFTDRLADVPVQMDASVTVSA